jgi:hypothetical protein
VLTAPQSADTTQSIGADRYEHKPPVALSHLPTQPSRTRV